jgi:hypothetical protein
VEPIIDFGGEAFGAVGDFGGDVIDFSDIGRQVVVEPIIDFGGEAFGAVGDFSGGLF